MLRIEFENLTGLKINEDEYQSSVEPRYMTSKLNKQQWCKQYLKRLRQDIKAVNKSELKYCLKNAIENWEHDILVEKYQGNYDKKGNFIPGEDMDEDEYYVIKYMDGSTIRFDYEYDGKKPSLINITNIYLQNGYESMDYYFSLIGDEELVESFKEYGDIPSNTLIIDMNDYFLELETKTTMKEVA